MHSSEDYFGFMDNLPATEFFGSRESENQMIAQRGGQEQQRPGGEFYLIDDARTLGSDFFSKLKVPIEKLTDLGVQVVVFTTDGVSRSDVGQILSAEAALTKELIDTGFTDSSGDIKPDVVACLIAFDQGNVTGVACDAGNTWGSALEQHELDLAERMIDGQAGRGSVENNQAAVRFALEYFAEEIQASMAEQESEAELETSVGVPETGVRPEKVVSWVGGALGIIGLVTMALYGKAEFTRRRAVFAQISELNKKIAPLYEKFVKHMEWDTPSKAYRLLQEIYTESYPKEAVSVQNRYTNFLSIVSIINKAYSYIETTKVGYFSKRAAIDAVRIEQTDLYNFLQNILDEIEKTIGQFNVIKDQIDQANARFDLVKSMVATTTDWVSRLHTKHPEYIGPADELLSDIYQKLKEASECFGTENKKLLLGSDLLAKIIQQLEEEKSIFTKFPNLITAAQAAQTEQPQRFQDWSEDISEPAAFLSPVLKQLEEISDALRQHAPSSEVSALIDRASEQLETTEKYCRELERALQYRDAKFTALLEFTGQGFSESHIAETKEAVARYINQAVQLGRSGQWDTALESVNIIKDTADACVQEMQTIRELRQRNEAALQRLSSSVSLAQSLHSTTIAALWSDLEMNYHTENYRGFESHFANASKLLQEVFDDPASENDLASQAGRENSMEQQAFTTAEATIKKMERSFVTAESLMDQLQSHHKLVESARDGYASAISSAERDVSSATLAGSDPFLNRMVGPEVDAQLDEARRLLTEAREKGVSKIFITANSLANEASRIAIVAKQEKNQQISEIKSLYSELEAAKSDAVRIVQNTSREVAAEEDAIVSIRTMEADRRMKGQLTELQNSEQRLNRFEDRQLASELQNTIDAYERLERQQVRQVLEYLAEDKREYEQLLDRADSAIGSARSAIREAENKVNDHRAKGAGNSYMNAATDALPPMPNRGAAVSFVESVITKAASAESLANQARRAAEEAIAIVVAAEAREQARREAEAAEERRKAKERQDAIDLEERKKQKVREALEEKQREKQRELDEQKKRKEAADRAVAEADRKERQDAVERQLKQRQDEKRAADRIREAADKRDKPKPPKQQGR